MKTIAVIPTYNEAENIPDLIHELYALGLPNFSTLIVDDNSPDGTADIAESVAEENTIPVYVMRRPSKRGLGTAYRDGFQWALKVGADAVVQMDADFSHSPSYIPHMLSLLKEYDVVVGSRYVKGGKLDERWSFGRYLLSWWANAIYTRLILNLKTLDTTAGFKAWRRETLLGLDLSRIRSNGYDFQVEMAYVTEKLGYRIIEIPIYFEDRRIGESKLNMPIKIESALRVWDVWWQHHRLTPSDRGKPLLSSSNDEDRAYPKMRPQ
ncbi:MAG: polyprenol monophosphomannose synthase [Anaerolineae bacterium]|nr:polyprenol monophosphomannose synthase [Anaerolineae bacterium]